MADVLLDGVYNSAIVPALALLPPKMTSLEALVAILAIGLQESKFETRCQANNGPAHSYWQMERPHGVLGVLMHPASRSYAAQVCTARNIQVYSQAVWQAMLTDDVLGAAFARLLIYTDAMPLPALGDRDGCWRMYNLRLWRPGAPRPDDWVTNYQRALSYVKGLQ